MRRFFYSASTGPAGGGNDNTEGTGPTEPSVNPGSDDDSDWPGLLGWLQGISEGFSSLAKNIASGIISVFEGPLSALKGGLDNIVSVLQNIADSIVNPIKAFLETLFVPDMSAVNDKFLAIRAKYGFVDSVIESGEALGNIFTNAMLDEPEPPVIYIDLSAAESEYDYGDKVAVLDFSWYSRYKPTVDVFLSAFMWGAFLWQVYVRLPSIIGGASGLVRRADKE